MEYNQYQKTENTLTGPLKEYYQSEELSNKLFNLGEKNSLPLDKIGAIAAIIHGTLLGTESSKTIEDKLKKIVPEDKINEVLRELNEDIFLPVREMLKSTSETPVTSTSINPNKESILAEIENPTPTTHPISIADHTVAGPAVVREIIADKLAGPVNVPAQRVVASVGGGTPKAPEKPKTYAADPYREPIN